MNLFLTFRQPPTFSFEEPPISIKSCLVDIAHDYSRKRKHVFRLTTYSESVYLLQAEDKGTMMSWIQAIKTNNNPDNDVSCIFSLGSWSRCRCLRFEAPGHWPWHWYSGYRCRELLQVNGIREHFLYIYFASCIYIIWIVFVDDSMLLSLLRWLVVCRISVVLFGLTVFYPWPLLATFLSVFEQGTVIYKCIVIKKNFFFF